MKESLLVAGVEVFPLLTPTQTQHRSWFEGEDEQGLYIACQLDNVRRSPFYDWYVFVSPEDLPLMEAYSWCGNICGPNHCGIEVRRREVIDGKQYSRQLAREIWKRMGRLKTPRVNRLGHPLDFRRRNLSAFTSRASCRGIVLHKNAWQVQITVSEKNVYVGRASSPDEGYRMYNRRLRELKEEFPHDQKIQSSPYNEVVPQF